MSLSREEYERIKQEEKAHLAAIRRLKEQYRQLSRKRKLLRHIEAATRSPEALEELEQTLAQIREETARIEAMLDLALEMHPSSEEPHSTEEPPASDTVNPPLPEKTIGRIHPSRKPDPPYEREED